MEISRASESDLSEILILQKLAYQENARRYNDFGISPLTQTFEELQKEAEDSVILKAVEDKIVGSVRAFESEGSCYIGRLVVHPDYQNRGIGKALIEAIENCFEGVRYELFTGHLDEKNLAFYEKLGYKKFKLEMVTSDLQFIYLENKKGVFNYK
ncbi:MAG: GNAT family N-acetyltransferase [Ruminiclostridium sp.]